MKNDTGANFINNGGVDLIANELGVQNAINGRVQRCSVNTRTVLLSGVYGGATNAVRGAVIGGTVGSFSVPILGTAAGAVVAEVSLDSYQVLLEV